jgi:hypothetical protein
VPYFHLVFTLPSELRPVVASNRERMFGLLFEAASRTLLLLSRDARHLGATPAIGYLGRYTHRVGISNARLLHADEHRVTFATKDGRSCTVTPVKFLKRLLLHVLPKGFHKIRHYGLCSSHHVAAGTLDTLRAKLAATTSASEPMAAELSRVEPALPGTGSPESWVECMLALTGVDVLRCPRCKQGRLIALPLDFQPTCAFEDTS